MKRVLVVSYVFPPMVAGGATRMGQFAKYLPQFGWLPTVLTSLPSPDVARDDTALAALDPRVDVVRVPCPEPRVARRGQPQPRFGWRSHTRRVLKLASQLLLFPDRQVLWIPRAYRAGLAALETHPHHAILATYGPASNLLVASMLSRRTGLPLIVDFRDLWSDLPTDAFPTDLHRRTAHRLESLIVRRARHVIAVSPGMASHLARIHGKPPHEVTSIPNGFDPDDFALVRDTRVPGQPFRLTYCGSVLLHYDLEPFWAALASLQRDGVISRDSFRVEFVGNLSLDDPRRWNVTDLVECRPFVAHREVFAELGRADALLLVETPGYYKTFSYAAKVFDYILTGKPVLALVEQGGNSAALLEEAQVGVLAEPKDPVAIRSALVSLLAQRGRAPRNVSPDETPYSRFSRRSLSRLLASVLDHAASTPGSSGQATLVR